jgi:hypothetical protein
LFIPQAVDNLGINYDAGEQIFGGHNSLFSEVNWFYPKNGSNVVDRVVTYNYREGTWTTGSLARTTYVDKGIYEFPYATQFYRKSVGNFSCSSRVNSWSRSN